MHHLLERSRDEEHELEEQERSADRDRAGGDECRAEHERQHPTSSDRTLHEPPHDEERPLAADGADERVLAVLDEAPGDMIGGAVRTQVLGGGQPFLDAAVQPAERAHLVGRLRHRTMPGPHDHDERQTDVDRHAEAEPPVDHAEHDDHAARPTSRHRRPW